MLPPDFVVHVNWRPASRLLLASYALAATCRVNRTLTVNRFGVTTTYATGTLLTVTCVEAVMPPVCATTETGPPAATPVAVQVSSCVTGSMPPALTVTVPGAGDCQVTDRPDSTLPFASFCVAVSTAAWPTMTVTGFGVMVIDAVGAGMTVVVFVSALDPLCAMIWATPGVVPMTRPLPFTSATPVTVEVHVTAGF